MNLVKVLHLEYLMDSYWELMMDLHIQYAKYSKTNFWYLLSLALAWKILWMYPHKHKTFCCFLSWRKLNGCFDRSQLVWPDRMIGLSAFFLRTLHKMSETSEDGDCSTNPNTIAGNRLRYTALHSIKSRHRNLMPAYTKKYFHHWFFRAVHRMTWS